MNRRMLVTSGISMIAAGGALSGWSGVLAQATPEAMPPEDMPLDPRAREIGAMVASITPLALLEALEATPITEPLLLDDPHTEESLAPRPWGDPLDEDIQHTIGAVLIGGSEPSIHADEFVAFGAYLLYESPEIAYDQLQRLLAREPDCDNLPSQTVGGTKAWRIDVDGGFIAVYRIANVVVFGYEVEGGGDRSTGLLLHLGTVAESA